MRALPRLVRDQPRPGQEQRHDGRLHHAQHHRAGIAPEWPNSRIDRQPGKQQRSCLRPVPQPRQNFRRNLQNIRPDFGTFRFRHRKLQAPPGEGTSGNGTAADNLDVRMPCIGPDRLHHAMHVVWRLFQPAE